MNLDLDWLMIEKKMTESIDEKYVKEKMDSIMIHYIYIDTNYSIVKIISEKESLVIHDDFSILPGNRSIQIIKDRSIYLNKKYKLVESLLYNVDIDSDLIQSYNSDNTTINFLKVLPFFDIIKIAPSLFVFHPLNYIYMVFIENQENVPKTKKVLFRKDTINNYTPLNIHTPQFIHNNGLESIQYDKYFFSFCFYSV